MTIKTTSHTVLRRMLRDCDRKLSAYDTIWNRPGAWLPHHVRAGVTFQAWCKLDARRREIRERLKAFSKRTGETMRKVPELAGCDSSKSHSFKIGEAYLIRTVTMHYTGRAVAVTDSDVELEDAAWIADTGRYHNALVGGILSEIEPYPDRVCVARGAIVDFCEWKHPLPRSQK